MMNYIIFTVLSLFMGIYGIYHYRSYESEQRKMGYVEITAIITGHSTYPPRKGVSSSFIRHVKFQLNGEEHQADVHVNGIRDPKDIGKETVILVNTNNPKDAIFANFEDQKNMGRVLMAAGFLGFIITASLAYKKYFA